MNEIEKAIKTIKIAIAEVEWNCPLDYAIAFETAIEALQEKAERDKGCECCKNAVEIGAVDSDGTFRVDNGNEHCLPYIAVDNDTYGTSDLFDINYCPNCGRKLGEDNA